MSSGGDRQCGLGSLLPMSCRGRAEAFARRLHTRLRRLGAEPRPGEDSWLTAQPNRRHHSDSDVYFDFDVDLGSPSSPVDEAPEGGTLPKCKPPKPDPESGCVFSSPVEQDSPPSNSDSDANYFDLENDPDPTSTKPPASHKYQRLYDETQMTKNMVNLNKLKLSSEMRDQLINCKTPTPERNSPIKTQPLARENGFTDYGSTAESQNSLYSPIRFDDCQKRDSVERETFRPEDVDVVDSGSISTEAFIDGLTSPQEPELEEIDFSQKINGTRDFPLRDGTEIIITQEDDDEHSVVECVINDFEVKIVKEEEGCPDNEIKEESQFKEAATETSFENLCIETQHLPEVDDSTQTEENQGSGQDDTESDERPQRVRRCSSLRTGKTPPGTPGRKKIVRFADVLGLDLADVKTFMDDIPNIPKSAFEDLLDADIGLQSSENFQQPLSLPPLKDKRLLCLFQQPGDLPNFLDILNTRSVCLENSIVQEGATIAICGTVRVRNLDFHKSVQIRYTLDSWKTFSDLQATYVPNSYDGFSDRFQFLLYAHTLSVGQRLEFAVRFMCKGCQFWDNNSGANYCFQCVSNEQQSNFYQTSCLHPGDNWHPSFY